MDYLSDPRRIVKNYLALPEETRKLLESEVPRQEACQREQVYDESITEIYKQSDKFAKQWNKSLDDVSLEYYTYDDYGGTSTRLDIVVSGLETDEQYYRRLLEHRESTKRREEWEQREYARLKAKFS